jgi:hypothetical protein
VSSIQLPNTLIDQIAAAGVTTGSVDEFVQQAVREKLADLKEQRRPETSQAADDFDALCDEATVAAPGNHLTRDQLHERD